MEVQRSGACPLFHLATSNSQIMIVLMKQDADKLLLKSMTDHGQDVALQINGILALEVISFDNTDRVAELMKLGVDKLIIKAMNNFEHD